MIVVALRKACPEFYRSQTSLRRLRIDKRLWQESVAQSPDKQVHMSKSRVSGTRYSVQLH